ncbi:MAG: outer membrane protein assembly factor BamA [Planctomycetes bacterium]|nr:outer membrane protein assembly factor BamA [Planctomycetota bacterium]
MKRTTLALPFILVALCGSVSLLATVDRAAAQTSATETHIVEVVIEGNERVDANRILSQMTLRQGSVYTPAAGNEDFKRIYALGEFDNVILTPEPVEGGLRLRVTVAERPLLKAIEFAGAKSIKEKKLRSLTGLNEGMPLDRHRLLSASQVIVDEYKRSGYYFAEATLDRERMESEGVARFTISEGPKVRVRKVVFSGNDSVPGRTLGGKIDTKARFWPFTSGEFSIDQLDQDVAKLKSYYISQGFLDVDVGRRLDFDAAKSKVTVTFVINEAARYRVASVMIRGAEKVDSAYLAENFKLQPGEFYTADALKADTEEIGRNYGRIGYVHATARPDVQYTSQSGKLDIVFDVTEGPKVTIGEIIPSGNKITRQKVLLRELDLVPGDTADSQAIEQARKRLMGLQLFSDVDLSLLPTRDESIENLLINVEETDTAQLIFGAGVSSNAGLIGNISLRQRNFDWARWPRGWNDRGAFRGAGQQFRIVLEPGTERQQYTIGFTEPYLFDRQLQFDTSGSYYDRDRSAYDEQRLGGQASLGKNLRKYWFASLGLRMEDINIEDVDADAPDDVFDVEGSSYLSAAVIKVIRDKTDSYFVPTTGSRATAVIEQAGALGGDYTFTKITLDGRRFWTVTEDVLGRRSVLKLHGRVGFAPGDPPIFERFYAGGQGSIRGFEYRGVGPFQRGEPIGGDFMLLMGGEYEFPLIGKNFSGVVFVDSGTVEESTSIGTLRAAAGFGLRFTVDMLGAPVPFALDFGFPLSEGDDDETQVFSFSIAWNF